MSLRAWLRVLRRSDGTTHGEANSPLPPFGADTWANGCSPVSSTEIAYLLCDTGNRPPPANSQNVFDGRPSTIVPSLGVERSRDPLARMFVKIGRAHV